ncbi:MAG: cytochrome c oxidase assembly protein subunit 15 [Verrucomicrobiales bacterium]|jgi:cytochrome c oxidase assembly protein subunit 15
MSKAFQIYAWSVVGVAVLLVWWGAAVTTEKAGMAVATWPLMYGQFNPEGWYKVWPYLLEHGHRLIASLVGVLTLVMFAVRFVRSLPAAAELLGLVAVLAVSTWAVHQKWYFSALLGALACCVWLGMSWKNRDWPLLTKLAGLALILVSLQAALGGIRVLEVSDVLATIHGCLAQIFFCLLVLIGLASSKSWDQRSKASEPLVRRLRWLAGSLLLVIFIQLVLGAAMRHHHRFGLADEGILTTGGSWFPQNVTFDLVILFLHKWWAVVVFVLAISCAIWTWTRLRDLRGVRRLAAVIGWLVVFQLLLGVSVIVAGKTFWITNFHVINGLTILTLSFCLTVKAIRTIPLAKESGTANVG